jgi:uncharacterized protein YbjT (DUF2867 family)
MFAIAGVTGQTGAAVARELLDRKQKVRVLVRSDKKGVAWREKGAEPWVLDLGDAAALAAALEGVRGAYLIVPPCYESSEPNAAACRVVDVYRAALESRPIQQVVVLSSIGAQHPKGTGPIIPCHYAEQQLRTLRQTRCTFLRSAYFMENFRNFMPAIRGQGVLPVLVTPSRRTTMVSVQDIGRFTAATLTEPVADHQVVEISGPTEQSFDDVATLFSNALGTQVTAVRVPESNIVATLTSVGMPPPTAELYRQMAVAVEAGLVAFERGSVRQVRGAVPIEEVIARLAA